MWWIVAAIGLYVFRKQIGRRFPSLFPEEKEAQRRTAFYGQLITIVSVLVYIVPLELFGLHGLKRVAYLSSLWSVVATSIFTIKVNHGAPTIPQNISWSNWRETCTTTLQPWLQQVMQGGEFNFLFFALIFLTAYPSIVALLILGRHRLWAVCTYCTKEMPGNPLWLRFAPTWAKLKAKEPQVLAYAALGEIVLALWLTVSIFLPTRQIVTCLLYWNYLKMRYQVPRSHELQLKAWRRLGGMVEPVFKAVPILRRPVDLAKDWFQPQYVYQSRPG